MNCLEARRQLLENPASEAQHLQQHLQVCPGCTAFAAELKQQEAQLREALNIPVPPRLAERVLLATSLRRPRWRQSYAWAASILLTVLLGMGGYWGLQPQTPASWSEVVLAHVLNERESLEKDDTISTDRLLGALASFGLSAKADLGRIRYLERCEMPGGKGLHVVIDTNDLGQVTLVFPPKGTQIEHGRSTRDGFAASMLLVGPTTIGVVTEHPEKLEQLARWLRVELQVNGQGVTSQQRTPNHI